MSVDAMVHTINTASVTLSDGTGTPVTLTITNDTTVTIDGLTGRALNDLLLFQRRGQHFSAQNGQRVYPTVTIEFLHNGFKGNGAAPGTPLEFATFQGTYSGNTSTTSVGTRGVKTINIGLSLEGTDYGGTDGSMTLANCALQSITPYSDGEPSTYSITWVVTGAIGGDLSFDEV